MLKKLRWPDVLILGGKNEEDGLWQKEHSLLWSHCMLSLNHAGLFGVRLIFSPVHHVFDKWHWNSEKTHCGPLQENRQCSQHKQFSYGKIIHLTIVYCTVQYYLLATCNWTQNIYYSNLSNLNTGKGKITECNVTTYMIVNPSNLTRRSHKTRLSFIIKL